MPEMTPCHHLLCLFYGRWLLDHGLRPNRWLGADCGGLAFERRKFRRGTDSIVWGSFAVNFQELKRKECKLINDDTGG